MAKQHPLSLVGAAIVTLSAILFLFVFLMDWFGLHQNPYVGIVFFLVIPAIFVAGLLLVPAGYWLKRRRVARGLEIPRWPPLDLNTPRHRRAALAFLSLTLVNLLIVSLAGFKGIEFMDSPQFCGQVCHTVMGPQYVASREGPHARVDCVDCHIGPGASWFVKAKVDGSRRVLTVARGSFSRPIPTPVHNLRPASDTCGQCHSAGTLAGDWVTIVREYGNDEKNTESTTRLVVHVGGRQRPGVASGIHWHAEAANEIEYVALDAGRQTIPYVRVKDARGVVREYRAEGVTDAQLAAGERRRMDCTDCHNRQGHPFPASAERAVDEAIAHGEISRDLPFVRRETVNALKAQYPDQRTADMEIAGRLRAFYRRSCDVRAKTHAADLEDALRAAQRLYDRNVFPEMRVTWGTYPDNRGHADSPGCFRCHDDQHRAADGRVIRQDCDLCHDAPE
jgi:nitrate/TMAO reductase-like tetraheme cytochrome c subunit